MIEERKLPDSSMKFSCRIAMSLLSNVLFQLICSNQLKRDYNEMEELVNLTCSPGRTQKIGPSSHSVMEASFK